MIGYTLEEHTRTGIHFDSWPVEQLNAMGFGDMVDNALDDMPGDKWSDYGMSSDLCEDVGIVYILRSHYLLPIVAA